MSKQIPLRAKQILVFINAYKKKYDYSPSRREIMGTVKVEGVDPIPEKITSTSLVNYYIKTVLINRCGFVDELPRQSRTIHITLQGRLFLQGIGAAKLEARERDLLKREREVDMLLKQSGLDRVVKT